MKRTGTRATGDFHFKPYPIISNQPVYAQNGMVSSSQPFASRVGVEILQKGGNAVDAAIAVSLMLNACEPWMSSPGGSSFYLLWDNAGKEMVALDACGVAPRAATPDAFRSREEMTRGLKALTIPGSMAGHWELLSRYGTMSFAEVAEPAIRCLEEGFPMSNNSHTFMGRLPDILKTFPNLAATLAPGGEWPATGFLMKNPNLARTLRIVAEECVDAFNRGSVAEEMVRYVREHGGLWTMKDLEDYRVQWKKPIRASYHDCDMYGTPPPASTLTWMQAMKIAERFDWSELQWGSAAALHLITEIDKLAHSDGYNFVTDPDFVDIPLQELLSDAYAEAQAARIDLGRAAPGRVAPGRPREWAKTGRPSGPLSLEGPRNASDPANMVNKGCTTHICVVDGAGNAISLTNTVGTFFGGGDVLGDTGVLGTNGMEWMDIDTNPWSSDNPSPLVIEPFKRNRWSLSPGILMKEGKPFILIGGAGGDTTQSGIFQALLNMLQWDMNPQLAVSAPRTIYGDGRHYTGGTALGIEPELFGTSEELRRMGHDIIPKESFPAWTGFRPLTGSVLAIMIDGASKTFAGAAEPRIDGYVSGY